MADETKEQKVNDAASKVAQVAGIVGGIPTPASAGLELFSQLEPIVGPIAISAFAHLFHKIKHAKNPQEAANAALVAAHEAVEPYVDTTSQYAG